jgi:hypothetical protein
LREWRDGHGEAGESRSARRESAAARRASRSGPRSTTARRGARGTRETDATSRWLLGLDGARARGDGRVEMRERARRPRRGQAKPRARQERETGDSGERRVAVRPEFNDGAAKPWDMNALARSSPLPTRARRRRAIPLGNIRLIGEVLHARSPEVQAA